MFEHELRAQIAALHTDAAGAAFTEQQTEKWNELNGELDEQETRRARVRELAGNPRHLEAAVPAEDAPVARRRARGAAVPRHLEESRSRGLAAIDSYTDVLDARAADRLEQIVEEDVSGPEMGITSRYLSAVGDSHYNTAFGKMLSNPAGAHLKWTAREHEAVDRVNVVFSEQRALGLGSQGGSYPIPFTVDPSVLLTSSGSINPIRQLADVRVISGNHWVGVSSEGVVAAYSAEAVEASDGSPTLTQPTADVEKFNVFVPFSIEVGEDWASLQSEMLRLIQDAKDVLESQKFLTGLGHASYEPQGLLTGATAVVTTAATAVFGIGDVYAAAEAVPARWRPTTKWVASPTYLDKTHRLVGGGSTTELPVMPDRGGGILGKPAYEWSSMSTATTSGSTVVSVGDFYAAYLILDRVGMTAEIVPHLFGTVRGYPTGQRGIYAYGRNTGLVKAWQPIRSIKLR
jgi:HK97 family phage major capsid protein